MAEYVRDLDLSDPLVLARQKGARLHWLHPDFGPSPDHLGLVEAENEQFMVAIWDDLSLTTAFELLDRRRTAAELEHVYTHMRGWILQTSCWVLDGQSLVCEDHALPLPPAPMTKAGEARWRTEIYRSLAVAVVEISLVTPIGADIRSWAR